MSEHRMSSSTSPYFCFKRLVQCILPACWLVLSALAIPVSAQTVHGYTVEVIDAGPLSELLDEHLEIQRHREDPDLDEQEFRRLVDITPQQIRELFATEGYFSAVVESELDMTGGHPVARFRIQRGEPTRVGKVEIHFTGDIASETHVQRVDRLRQQWRDRKSVV